MSDISTSVQQQLEKLQIQNTNLKKQLSDMSHEMCQLKIRVNEQASLSVDFKVAWQSLQIRQKSLAIELQRLNKIYGTKKLELRCEKQQQRLIKNNFNFEALMGRQYNRTVEHYPDEHDESEPEDEDDEDRPEERKETYYKQLLQELRGELAEKSRKLNETEQTNISRSLEISSLKLFSRKAANSFNAQITSLRENLAKNEKQLQRTATTTVKKEKKIEKEKNDMIEKIKKQANQQVHKARTEIVILKKQMEQKQGNAVMIKEQYERAQEIFQAKLKQSEERIQQLIAKHHKQLKEKDKQITQLKASIEKLYSQGRASSKQKESRSKRQINSSPSLKENLHEAGNKVPEDKYAPYRNKQQYSPGKIRKTAHSNSPKKKRKEDASQESIDVHTIKDLKKQIKKLEKMIDQAEP